MYNGGNGVLPSTGSKDLTQNLNNIKEERGTNYAANQTEAEKESRKWLALKIYEGGSPSFIQSRDQFLNIVLIIKEVRRDS